jgi:tRNA pseudouridine55 synthase
MPDGLLLLNKPRGLTSHDVVQILRNKLHCRRIGHTGTLDPLAEGLLILLLGAATRHQQALQGHDKIYEGCIRLGVQTDTADAAGKPIHQAPVLPLDRQLIEQALQACTGELSQVPPAYSAVKVRGKPAYWWARRDNPQALAPRKVTVREFSILGFEPERIQIRVRCSAGTYIRALAESVARQLGTVGHLESLTRVQIGSWLLADASHLEWVNTSSAATVLSRVVPLHPEQNLSAT